MRRLLPLAAALALAGTLVHAPLAWACSCVATGTPQTQFKHADVVFVGAVSKVSPGNGDLVAQFTVTQVYKGTVPGAAGVHTAHDVASCGVSFIPGTRYAVFAVDDGGVYRADLCGGTTNDVGVLDRAGFHPGSPASALSVMKTTPSRPVSRTGPLAGAALLLVVVVGAAFMYRRARAGGAPPAAR
ncbi:MAG: hypothetical protein ACXVQ6_03585 [Actinomycetota bacterium]